MSRYNPRPEDINLNNPPDLEAYGPLGSWERTAWERAYHEAVDRALEAIRERKALLGGGL